MDLKKLKDKSIKTGKSEATLYLMSLMGSKVKELESKFFTHILKCLKLKASKMYDLASSEAGDDLLYTAKASGVDGNLINLTFVNPAGPSAALGVVVSGKDITVNLGTDGASVLNSTLKEVLDALNASLDAKALGTASLLPGVDDTATVDTAVAQAYLEGGEKQVSYK